MKGSRHTTDAPERAPRIAASSYLNTAPLIWSFAHGPRQGDVHLLTDKAPARCADMLARGEADAALVPVIEYQRLPEVSVVPGVCVGARRRVRSVVLVTRRASLEDVRSVALDLSSRTSAALVEIIFREFFGREPELTPSEPDLKEMLGHHDAALVIGDPAMTFAREGLRVYDLAALWREHTGLGFVFAMWMVREGAGGRAVAVDFAGARDEGLARVEEIIDAYEESLGLARAELLAYLHENICFTLDAEMQAGLNLYYELAHKHGMIESVRPLKMLDSGRAA
ncbi:MAG TPA: menaquinone biosynthesis protein [Pyrinomonadaceae bacterium]|nr:menaquinone biosynthesis protein [Pyrinomonadaceae bacterium]